MVEFRRPSDERVNVFEVDEHYLFKHYFNGKEVFDRLRPYYNNQQYRFEVPADDFEALRSFLADHDYELAVVDSLPEYVVVVKQYTAHPENIFKASVIQRQTDGYNCFLLADQDAVEQATREGAVHFIDTNLENPF